MTELLTAAQMRAIEAAAIASGEVTGLELMERAGRGVVEAIFEEWPELKVTSHRAVVLCGPGNNGGDGFVVARLLKEWGWEVEVFLYGDPERMPPDARVNYQRWRRMGEVGRLTSPVDGETWDRVVDWARRDRTSPLHVIDALFGTGLTRPLLTGDGCDLILLLVALDDLWMDGGPVTRAVAIDVTSGLCADSGRVLLRDDADGPVTMEEVKEDPRFFAFQADLTVTFHRPKCGHFLDMGPQLCGRMRVADIGLGQSGGSVEMLDRPFPGYVRKRSGHKFDYGHALILSGPPGRTGAARLAARGALRIGAGLVTVGCPTEAIPENAARLDAVMLKPVADAAGLAVVLEDRRINALCLGPGMGTGEREAGLLAAALKLGAESATSGGAGGAGPASGAARRADGRSLVLDADALTLLAGRPELFAALHPRCILTPHAGEFARLFPDIAAKLEAPAPKGPAYSKVDATREAAARAGCVVLFKGPDTVIADPSGRCSINSAHYDRAAPWLATAGSGDVLSGFIAGLLARGFEPMAAAETAAWLHVECARSFGPGLIAEDLPEELPKVFRALGL